MYQHISFKNGEGDEFEGPLAIFTKSGVEVQLEISMQYRLIPDQLQQLYEVRKKRLLHAENAFLSPPIFFFLLNTCIETNYTTPLFVFQLPTRNTARSTTSRWSTLRGRRSRTQRRILPLMTTSAAGRTSLERSTRPSVARWRKFTLRYRPANCSSDLWNSRPRSARGT